MSYKITDNTVKFKFNSDRKLGTFLRNFAEEVEREAFKNTPKDTGRMRSDVIKKVNRLSGVIRWTKNYAIYQETKQFANYTTPGTGPHFAENAIKKKAKQTDSILRKSGLGK